MNCSVRTRSIKPRGGEHASGSPRGGTSGGVRLRPFGATARQARVRPPGRRRGKALMTERVFVDTNVLVYAHDLDGEVKRAIAEHVLRQLWSDETGVLSAQVLQEFYAALTNGGGSPVPRRAARDVVQAYSAWPVVPLDAAG